jgi:hypothetical protein
MGIQIGSGKRAQGMGKDLIRDRNSANVGNRWIYLEEITKKCILIHLHP